MLPMLPFSEVVAPPDSAPLSEVSFSPHAVRLSTSAAPSLSSLMPRFYGMTASAERIMELEQLPDEPAAEKKLSYEDLSEIKLEGMDFSYKNNHVLKNVNISIKRESLCR